MPNARHEYKLTQLQFGKYRVFRIKREEKAIIFNIGKKFKIRVRGELVLTLKSVPTFSSEIVAVIK